MKLGFIGAGNMGGAIIGGVVSSGFVSADDITVADRDTKKLNDLRDRFGVNISMDNLECTDSDVVFLCVKPNVIEYVIDELTATVKNDTVFVSIAAGQTLDKLAGMFDNPQAKIVRVMPNTPALVGEGMSAVCANENVTEEEMQTVLDIFNCLGKAQSVSENIMDAVTAVSGSSPAYVFMFIEAMADAAVRGGMSRDMAYTFAAQAVLGSAKMVLETKKHPAELKDMVCSPGGTTIDAVAVLEEEGMRNAVMKAMQACINKSKEM